MSAYELVRKTKRYTDKLKIDYQKCIGCGLCKSLCPMDNALFLYKGVENTAEIKNEHQSHSFKRKLGNITYTVKAHFSKDTDKTFKDRVQNLIINECLEKNEK